MSYNYEKLERRIMERCGSVGRFARKIGSTAQTIRTKLINGTAFKTDEVEKAVEVLGIDHAEINDYFFTLCCPWPKV